jgi:hypothetical protein
MLMLANISNEYGKFWDFWWANEAYHIPPASIPLLILGCLVGTGIGYSSWWCRSLVSATSFTLIGVMNKCLTVLLNLMIWDQHAKPGGIACLMLCIGGGIVYQQSPMRSSKGAAADSIVSLLAEDEAFKSDTSEVVREEEMDLVEKQSSSGAKRRA